jgi:hypothetical protein
MKMLRLVLVVAVMFCFMSTIASAQEIERKGVCRADIEKFCKDVQPGHGRMAKCLKQHEAELSPACMEHINTAKEKVRDFVKDCKADKEKFCKDVSPGKEKIRRCLKSNEAQLSPECQAHFKK